MDIKNIYIVRHGQTDMNKQNRIQGQNDEFDINEEGKKQAKTVKLELKNVLQESDFKVFSSPLKRAKSTADIISNGNYEVFDDFKEMYCGSYEGFEIEDFNTKNINMIFDNYCDQNKKIVVDNGETLRSYLFNFDKQYSNVSYPEGESKIKCAERFKKGLELAMDSCYNSNIIVVAHSLAIKSFLSCYVENCQSNVNHTDIIKLEYKDGKFINKLGVEYVY